MSEKKFCQLKPGDRFEYQGNSFVVIPTMIVRVGEWDAIFNCIQLSWNGDCHTPPDFKAEYIHSESVVCKTPIACRILVWQENGTTDRNLIHEVDGISDPASLGARIFELAKDYPVHVIQVVPV